jgi:predicted nuclease with TOPRIM domain
MFVLNKSIVITSLALSCPAFLYYYMSNLQQKINKYEENFELLNKKYDELSKNYIELIEKLNFNSDESLLKNMENDIENNTENITDELDEPLIF